MSKCNFLTYDAALSSSEEQMLRGCVSKTWKLRFSNKEEKNANGSLKTPKGWSVDFGGTLYPLPQAEVLMDGKLAYSDDLYELLGWRQRLLQEISTYDVYGAVPSESRPIMNDLILQQFSSALYSAAKQ